jgi:hypothetical protein
MSLKRIVTVEPNDGVAGWASSPADVPPSLICLAAEC